MMNRCSSVCLAYLFPGGLCLFSLLGSQMESGISFSGLREIVRYYNFFLVQGVVFASSLSHRFFA